MNKKLAFVLIAIVGIGLYALPSTVALFAGQHSFENIDPSGNQIDCVKCHGDVGVELVSNTNNAPHASFECEYCHRIEVGKASGDNNNEVGTTYHAASLVSCLECHGGITPEGHGGTGGFGVCTDCHTSMSPMENIPAGGFGLTNEIGDTGVYEAHNDFLKNEDGLLRYSNASNTACVACHTHVAVDITYDKPTTIKFDVFFRRGPLDKSVFSNETADGSIISYSNSSTP